MSDLTFRPRFKIKTSLPCEKVDEMISEKLAHDNPEKFGSTYIKGHFILRIHPSKKHFWSPQMDISVRKGEEADHTVIRCLMAPAPVVWTMFMFIYALSGFGALIGLMVASSQYSLEKDMWGLWIASGSVLLGLILYLVAQSGKRLSREEMLKLREFVRDLNFPEVGEPIE